MSSVPHAHGQTLRQRIESAVMADTPPEARAAAILEIVGMDGDWFLSQQHIADQMDPRWQRGFRAGVEQGMDLTREHVTDLDGCDAALDEARERGWVL